jgi:carboxymethylenebutenolidase
MTVLARAADVSYERAGEPLGGYLALPCGNGPHPALVLVPDVRGLYEHYRDVAQRFAGEGFATLAVDLYTREGEPDLPDMDAVFRWMAALPDRRVLADLQSARDYLAARSDVRASAIGIAGFCMGGQYTLMSACTLDGLAAAVSFYGMLSYVATNDLKPEHPIDMVSRLGCPYLAFFGEDDAIISAIDVEALRARTAHARHPVDIVTYRDAGHAFFNDSRPEMYREAAARDAWPRTIAFLKRHLGSR